MDRTNRVLLITLIVLLVVALAFPMALGGLMGMQAMQGQMTPGDMPGPPWGMGLVIRLGGVAVIAFWTALIVGVVLLVRMFAARQEEPSTPASSPLEIAQRRYAAGEITREQFQQIQQDLNGGPQSSKASQKTS